MFTTDQCVNHIIHPAPRRYERYSEGPPKLGWIFNMLPTSIPDASGNEKSGLDMYFLEQDGGTFKATVCLIIVSCSRMFVNCHLLCARLWQADA